MSRKNSRSHAPRGNADRTAPAVLRRDERRQVVAQNFVFTRAQQKHAALCQTLVWHANERIREKTAHA